MYKQIKQMVEKQSLLTEYGFLIKQDSFEIEDEYADSCTYYEEPLNVPEEWVEDEEDE